jgi:hypothetical protein
VKPTGHNAKTPRTATGRFALPCGLLHLKGSGAPAVGVRPLLPVLLVACFLTVLLAPAAANAAFSRPFLRQITTVAKPGGVAVNAQDDLWVGDLADGDLAEFSPAYAKENEPLGSFGPVSTAPASVAIEHTAPGDFFLANNLGGSERTNYPVEVFSGERLGEHVATWGPSDEGLGVAVDNSTDSLLDPSACGTFTLSPSECIVYVDSHQGGIKKLNSKGEPVDFVNSEDNPVNLPNVSGNEITTFATLPEGPGSLAVDPEGDIYVLVQDDSSVAEFRPSGEYVQSFDVGIENKEVPPVSPDGDHGSPEGVAFDPVSGHLLVAVSLEEAGVHFGAVEEFEAAGPEAGRFVNQLVETVPGARLTGNAGRGESMQMTVDSKGDLYVVDPSQHVVDVYNAGYYTPALTLGAVSKREPTSAVLNGTVNPDETVNKAGVTACNFQYVSETAFDAPIINEAQTLTVAGATGGDFTVSFNSDTTSAIAYDATVGEMKSALEALPSIGPGDVGVTGGAGGPYTVEFLGALAHLKLPEFSADASALTPVGATAMAAITKEGSDGGFGTATTVECEPSYKDITGETVKPVEAKIEPLTPGEAYRYRLVASSGGEKGGTAETEAKAFTAPAPPKIVSSTATEVTSTFADLEAKIDPRGADTSYHFEYLTAAAYAADGGSFVGSDPATSVPVPDASIGSGGPTGSAVESVLQHVGGLQSDTAYRFRVVASNAIGTSEETEQSKGTFTTQPEPFVGAPDHRAYELVTPAVKEGGSDMFALPEIDGEFFNSDVGTPSESGEGFILETDSAFGKFPFAQRSAYVFKREFANGRWGYTSLASQSLGVQSFVDAVFDPEDLSRVALNDGVGASQSEAGERLESLAGAPGGPYVELHADAGFHVIIGEVPETKIVGASHSLSHVVLESVNSPTACAGGAICEWDGGYETAPDGEVTPELRVVDVDQAGQPMACGATLGAGTLAAGEAHNAVSADGSRVFFTAASGAGCKAPGQLYARVETPQPSGEATHTTIELSKPETGVTLSAATYVGASEDGSRVFFVTETELTKEAVELKLHDPELYECDIVDEQSPEGEVAPKCELTRVSSGEAGEPFHTTGTGALAAGSKEVREVRETAGRFDVGEVIRGVGIPSGTTVTAVGSGTLTLSADATVSGNHVALETGGADVQTVLAIAPKPGEASVIYFTADGGVLASNENSDGEHATPGDCNSIQGACGLYRYQSATATGPAKTTFIATSIAETFGNGTQKDGGVTPVPLYAAYTTPEGHYLLFENGGIDLSSDIYRYDAGTGSLTFIAPGSFVNSAPGSNGDSPAFGPMRAMSDNGEYVFFNSSEAVLPAAENDTLDTYEWHDGTISLIGSGKDNAPTYFLGYSPNLAAHTEQAREGGNVFIGTHAQLSPQDTNSVGNIYDARVCEPESPCIKPAKGETAQCEGGSCQSPPPSPLFQTPATNTLASSGNITPESSPTTKVAKKTVQCKKGLVKKKIKKKEECIKAKTKKKAKKSNHGRAK